MRSRIKITIIILVAIAICGIIATKNNVTNQKIALGELPSPEYSENSQRWGTCEITFEGAHPVDDNPWKFNAGIIKDLGDSLLLTPNTSVILLKYPPDQTIQLKCQIFPQVADISDGGGVIIQILDASDNVIDQKECFIPPDKEWHDIEIPVKDFPNADKIKLLCNNGTNNNSDADWLIFRQSTQLAQSTFGRNGYVKSATYYAEEWPINFWNSDLDSLQNDMEKIRSDGFDSIILVIPWREFQPSIKPVSYNEYAFRKLDTIMNAAAQQNLDVYTRIGYTWDFYNDQDDDIVLRFISLFCDDNTKLAWLDYAEKLYGTLNRYDNFQGAFLTWEDYSVIFRICGAPHDIRINFAQKIGLQDWLKNRYSLKDYNDKFGTNYESYTDIPIPQVNSPEMEAFYEFNDVLLNNLLANTQKVFNNISMEVRLDAELVKNSNGKSKYYTHEKTYPCEASDFTSTMYGIPMGFENKGERVTATEAAKKTDFILENLTAKNNGKPVYVEQFLFADNTPQFAHNAQIKKKEVGMYLRSIDNILRKHTRGYGIWTYRNYRNNLIYNPGFFLESKGWEEIGNPDYIENSTGTVCKLESGEGVYQKIPNVRMQHISGENYTVCLDVLNCTTKCTVSVSIGGDFKQLTFDNDGQLVFEFPKSENVNLQIQSLDGEFCIDNVRLFSFVQNGFLYDEAGNEMDHINDIRFLNSKL